MNADRFLPRLLGGLVLAGIAGAIAFAVHAAAVVPDGPADVVWDKSACAHCRMHLGEPGFAAQLTTTAGTTLLFDDPGCLFEYLADATPAVHAIWFHHASEQRWLRAPAVAFAPVSTSPMGFGLAATDPGTVGAIDYDAARARCTPSHTAAPEGHR